MTTEQIAKPKTVWMPPPRAATMVQLRTDLEMRRLEAVRAYSMEHMPKLGYHNYLHVQDVVKACDRLANSEGISDADRQVLRTAAYLHDIIYLPYAKDNEEKSAELAGELLQDLGYRPCEIERVKSAILATKLPSTPRNIVERILCDADLDNLGRSDFHEKSEEVRKELGIGDPKAWLRGTLALMLSHSYYTESARAERDAAKAKNMFEVMLRLSDPMDLK
jgi:predicted metal-dependent HD superfamily phosphohydrolase